jgi:hypothetical protein
MTKKKLPFGALPAHWGLKGKLREVAKAEWELEGEALEYKLLEINLANYTEEDVARKKIALDRKYRKITDEEADIQRHELDSVGRSEKENKLAFLDLRYKHKRISDDEYEKEKAIILDEPYVRVAKIHTDPKNPAFGGIVLDWNDAFVRYLEDNGYTPNPDPATTVENWFNDVCKNIAVEAFDGVGDFNERLEQKTSDVIYHRDLPKKD